MLKKVVKIQVGQREWEFPMKQFESLEEALNNLEREEVLQMVNYTWALQQRNMERRRKD